jgi:hypothetical protein
MIGAATTTSRYRNEPAQGARASTALLDHPPGCRTRIPLARQLPCPVCAPHEHHLLPCDTAGCACQDPPIPGTTR